jgi:serpin B
MSRSIGEIVLPRFYTENKIYLVGALTQLGMGVAFQERLASFGAMTSLPAHVDRVTQQTWIQVDEEGTEAHAATFVTMVMGMVDTSKETKFRMVVDRPFFYIIRDDISGMILFMGVTVEPEEKGDQMRSI